MRKNYIFTLFVVLNNFSVKAETPYYLDFKFILNQSDAGKKTQDFLKKLDNGFKGINKKEKNILEEEKINSAKKVLATDEYKKSLRIKKKVSDLQKERNELIQSVAKDRSTARKILLKKLNPIIKEYMKEKILELLLKKSILLADEQLDITKDIMSQLNKELKSISLN